MLGLSMNNPPTKQFAPTPLDDGGNAAATEVHFGVPTSLVISERVD